MKLIVRLPLFLFLLAGLSAFAVAGPPYFTDDPETVEFHHWEVYIASQYLHRLGEVDGISPHFEFNYGIVPNVQLHLITPFAYADPAGGANQWGYGDTELGLKFRFVQETKSRPMVGIFPLIEVPTGNANKGLGAGQTGFFLPLWLQKSFGNWSSYGGGGYWHNPGPGNRDYWFTGIQSQTQATKQLSLGAELFHTTASTIQGSAQTGFNFGAFYDFDDGHHLLFSVGKGFQKQNLGTAYLAFQWTFGPTTEARERGVAPERGVASRGSGVMGPKSTVCFR